MKVTFTKVDRKRYRIAIERRLGPTLMPRYGPGYDDLMPHDLAHFLVEEYYRIQLGVWGQLAAGGGGMFTPAPEDNALPVRRRTQRLGAVGRADMARSEELVMVTVAAWERSIGRTKHRTSAFLSKPDAATLQGAVQRFDEVARRWRSLEYGGSLTLTWPEALSFDDASSHRGRRTTKRTPHRARR